MIFVRRNALYISAVLLLLLLFGLSSLAYPFGRDQGIHAQVGAAWLDGQLPYRDVWHPKGFLSFVPHALATAVFGHQMWAIRIVDLVWQFATGLLIFLLGSRRMGRPGALLAAGLYYLTYYSFGYWHTAQPEGFLTPVVLLAVWFYDRAALSKRPPLHYFLSGLIIALAPWFKQTAVVFPTALLAWAIFDYWPTKRLRKNIILILGGILLTNTLILTFTAITGMLAPMIEAFRYALIEYPKLADEGLLELVRLSVQWAIANPILVFPFLAGLGTLMFNRDTWPDWVGLLLLSLAGLAAIYIQRHLWVYHWVSTLPYMVLIGASALESAWTFLQSLADKKKQAVFWLLILTSISLVLPPLNRNLIYDTRLSLYLLGRTSQEDYLSNFSEIQEITELSDHVASHTQLDDYIFVWGHYAMIYYLADRPNPTRFINDPPLSLQHSHRADWRQEAAEDLAANPPAYIIVAVNDDTSFESQTSREQLPAFAALAGFMAANYQLETTIGNFELYTLIKR